MWELPQGLRGNEAKRGLPSMRRQFSRGTALRLLVASRGSATITASKREGDKIGTVNSLKKLSWGAACSGRFRGCVFSPLGLVCLSLIVLLCGVSTRAQSQQPAIAAEIGLAEAGGTQASGGQPQADQRMMGSIRGSVVDASGAFVAGA